MKTGRIKLLWALLIILVGLTIFIMASCAPVKIVPPVSCLNSEWIIKK